MSEDPQPALVRRRREVLPLLVPRHAEDAAALRQPPLVRRRAEVEELAGPALLPQAARNSSLPQTPLLSLPSSWLQPASVDPCRDKRAVRKPVMAWWAAMSTSSKVTRPVASLSSSSHKFLMLPQ